MVISAILIPKLLFTVRKIVEKPIFTQPYPDSQKIEGKSKNLFRKSVNIKRKPIIYPDKFRRTVENIVQIVSY